MDFFRNTGLAISSARFDKVITILAFTQPFPFWKKLVVVNRSAGLLTKLTSFVRVNKLCLAI